MEFALFLTHTVTDTVTSIATVNGVRFLGAFPGRSRG